MSKRRQTRDGRNYFCICASGEDFNVDAYARSTPLAIDRIYRRGDPIQGSAHRSPVSGLEIDLGNGVELDVEEQQLIAVDFLSMHADDLRSLRAFPEVTQLYLGLQEKAYSDSLGSIMDLSPLLTKTTLEIGINVTIWFCLMGPYCPPRP